MDGTCGWKDKSGNELKVKGYDGEIIYGGTFYEGYAIFQKEDESWGWVDTNGNILQIKGYDGKIIKNWGFSKGYAKFEKEKGIWGTDDENQLQICAAYGWVDTNGNVLKINGDNGDYTFL